MRRRDLSLLLAFDLKRRYNLSILKRYWWCFKIDIQEILALLDEQKALNEKLSKELGTLDSPKPEKSGLANALEVELAQYKDEYHKLYKIYQKKLAENKELKASLQRLQPQPSALSQSKEGSPEELSQLAAGGKSAGLGQPPSSPQGKQAQPPVPQQSQQFAAESKPADPPPPIPQQTQPSLPEKKAKGGLEFRLGTQAANIAGVLLILLGVVVGLQYTYTYVLTSNLIKSLAAFALGLLFLGAGELLSRKRAGIFSLGITAGGVAILYASTAISYFVLGVFPVYLSFILCVAIAVLAIFLSLRYASQTIANFALAGGFLPVYAVALGDSSILYILMLYLLLLNFFTLFISAKRNWETVKYISFLGNSAASFFILTQGTAASLTELAYVTLNFALYVFIAVIYPLRHKKPVERDSLLLTILNSLFHCAFVFGIINLNHFYEWRGLIALGLGVVYFAFSYYIKKILEEKSMYTLFFTMALAFLVLAVYYQFDSSWLAMAWLIEGVAFMAAGILSRQRSLRNVGGLAYALSVLAFLLFESRYVYTQAYLVKLTLILVGALGIWIMAYWQHKEDMTYYYSDRGRALRWSKIVLVAFGWSYLIYCASHIDYRLALGMRITRYSPCFYFFYTVFTAVYGLALLKKGKLKDQAVKYLGLIMLTVCAVLPLYLNRLDYASPVILFPWVNYLLLNICACLSLWKVGGNTRINPQARILILFLYILINLLELLIYRGGHDFNDMVISMVLICAALVYIVHGFKWNVAYTRKAGLVLAILALVKFFLIDLIFMESWQRILAYFGLGAVLIGISYIYQHFSRKLFDGGTKKADEGH